MFHDRNVIIATKRYCSMARAQNFNSSAKMRVRRNSQNVKEVLRSKHRNESRSSDHNKPFQFFKQRKHWSERCWWIFGFVLSSAFCAISIHNICVEWGKDPIKLNLSGKFVPISKISFPTITICPETKTSKDKLDLVSVYKALENHEQPSKFSDLELSRMEALVQVCDFNEHKTTVCDRFGNKYINESVIKMIHEMAPTLNDTLTYCKWQNKKYPCMQLFKPFISEKGVCFTFNALNSRDIYKDEMAPEVQIVTENPDVSSWSRDEGYPDPDEVNETPYPWRVFNANHDGGLSVYLRLREKDMEFLCGGQIHGFKVILSTPGESFKRSRQHFRIPTLEQANVLINTKMTKTAKDLRKYSSEARECYYSTERRLRFYKYYAKRNCENECLANFTLRECGCVKFSMPRDKHMRICGAKSVRCYQDAEYRLYGEDVIDGLNDLSAREFRQECNCLSGCMSIYYDAEIDRAKLRWKDWSTSVNTSGFDYDEFKYSQLLISFKDYQITTTKQSALYTVTDFMAICGGLLGLFLGLSVMSIVQFVYSFTHQIIRWIQHSKSNNQIQPFRRNIAIKNHTIHTIDEYCKQ